ncbi:hypothetical protein, partial [Streptomyces cadmiisoli]|uniref:hypothetical protein n=1 Tax=Streptomyces cadmiisoli TaxID=2184053 RepID=UPI00365E8BBA
PHERQPSRDAARLAALLPTLQPVTRRCSLGRASEPQHRAAGSIVIKWVAFNAATIARHAKQAYDYKRCVKLKWPIGYPGLIPGQYSKKIQGCK